MTKLLKFIESFFWIIIAVALLLIVFSNVGCRTDGCHECWEEIWVKQDTIWVLDYKNELGIICEYYAEEVRGFHDHKIIFNCKLD